MSSVELPPFQIEKTGHYCRLCLNVNKKLYQLFNSDETDAWAVTLSMKVSLCISLSISKQDKLPQKICQKCLNYVNEWFLFRKKARKVHLLLKEKLLVPEKGNGNNEEPVKSDKLQGIVAKNNLKLNLNSNSCLEIESLGGCSSVQSQPKRKKKHECSFCPDSFYFVNDLKAHKSLLHSESKQEMPIKSCFIAKSGTKLAEINMRTRYEMKCCGKVFFSKLKFRKHYVERHPGEKPFMCETCGKKDFISEETLKRHKILHSGKFRCDICQKTFTCNAILMLHKRDKHENDRPFICDVCGKCFVTELLMNYHKRFHTGEKKYVCEECGLAVVTSSSLAKHKRIHTQEKPHICHMCGKGFIIKGRLVEHLRVHTGERPYCCQICQKGFTIKDKLKRHMRVHSGEKQFSCEYCGNNYSTKCGLLSHLKTHTTK